MIVIEDLKNGVPIMFDCDDTLVMWLSDVEKQKRRIELVTFTDPYSGRRIKLIPNTNAIARLKAEKLKGNTVVVWSAGGWRWARTVVKRLNLTHHVDLVMSKPMGYIDDLHCTEWMGEWVRVNKDTTLTEEAKEQTNGRETI